jgi:hypothetical protein
MFCLAFALTRFTSRAVRGELFLALIGAYLAFRLVVDAWKPGVALVAGLTAIQVACVLGLAVTFRVWKARRDRRAMPAMAGTG